MAVWILLCLLSELRSKDPVIIDSHSSEDWHDDYDY